MAFIQVLHRGVVQKTLRLGNEATGIGRAPDNAVCLDDAAISNHHARIDRQDGKYVVSDLDSTNGISLFGERVRQHMLADGDEFSILEFSFRFLLDQQDRSRGVRSPKPYLQIYSADTLLRNIELHGKVVHIGRRSTNEVQIVDSRVSGVHARLEKRYNGYDLIDEDSTNGTFCAGERVSTRRLDFGDKFRISSYTLKLVESSPENLSLALMDGEDTDCIDAAHVSSLLHTQQVENSYLELILKSGTRKLPLKAAGDFSIGKGKSCNLRLRGLLAPKLAARIARRGEGFILAPESGGKVRVNGEAVKQAVRLKHGDHLDINRTELTFHTQRTLL